MRVLIRQGEGPAAAYARFTEEHAARQAAVDNALRQSAVALDSRRVTSATAAGDARKLRGIPAIARGVAGAIPGTSPHSLRV